ncbi:MAG: N-acyl-D-amino-acid deacylase [Candidatus Azotimanducaceae bacterium]|jgi:N-acyl-D-amino-acid deacylase
MTDIIIRNAKVLDGTGSEPFTADIAIEDNIIAEVGNLSGRSNAKIEIDADGLYMAPGFIDTHSHDDGAFFRYPGMEFKLAQGVTSVVAGNCGFSAIPGDPSVDPSRASGGILSGVKEPFTDLNAYFDAVSEQKPAINNMMLVGHNTLRTIAMGHEKRPPTSQELNQMKDHVRANLEQGACGFSTGLIYTPGKYSQTEEIIELASIAGDCDALYTTHMRNEGDHLLDAIDESLRIGIESNVHLHISHHKSAGKANWGKINLSLEKIDRALKAKQRVTLDVYPYTAGSGRMIEYFNIERINRDLAEVIRIASCPAFREYEGKSAVDIASQENLDVTEVIHKILTAPGGEKTLCIQFIIDEADVETNLAHKDMMVGSDGIPDLRGQPHPRLFGTFPRVLGHYVRERGILSLPEAIRRMTSLSAATFGMKNRGQIKSGFFADLVMFDPSTIIDTASYDDPKQEPIGIQLVIVNGKIALQDGVHSHVGSGQMLRYRQA